MGQTRKKKGPWIEAQNGNWAEAQGNWAAQFQVLDVLRIDQSRVMGHKLYC